MTTDHDLTGFQRDILQAIAAIEEEPYGLALKEWLDDRYSDPNNHSRLYQNLSHLEEASLITSEPIDKRTNAYKLTDDASHLLAGHASNLPATCERVAPATAFGPANRGEL